MRFLKARWKILVIVFSFLFLVFGVQGSSVFAQAVLPLTVAPARQELNLSPGEKTTVTVRVYNGGDTPVAGNLRVADFIVKDDSGTPEIVDKIDQASPRFAASSWVSLPFDRMAIAKQDRVSVQAKITVPSNARPGGRYVAIYFEPTTSPFGKAKSEYQAGSSVTSRIAALVYIRVAGPITEKAMITRLFSPSFMEYGPITVKAQILNRGDYHIRPRGFLSLTNLLGSQVDQQVLKRKNIFPDASRSYENKLGSKWMIGRYKIALAASYGEKGEALKRAIYVWVFPWRVALIIILSLIILGYLLLRFYKATKGKQKMMEAEVKKEEAEINRLREEIKKRKE